MALKNKLKNWSKNLKQKAKEALDALVFAAVAASLIGGLGLLAANAPNLHKAWLARNAGSKVVMIVVRDEAGRVRGGGTGFHVQARSGVTYIMTNAHVCEAFKGRGMPWVQNDEGRYMQRRIIEISEKTDLCLMEGLPGYTGLKLADYASQGDALSIIGFPLLSPKTISQGEITGYERVEFPFAAIVDAPKEAWEMTEAQCKAKPAKQRVGEVENPWTGEMIKACFAVVNSYTTNIVSYPGNSGSPAVNFWGNLEGVLWGGDDYMNHGMLITLPEIKEFLSVF